MSYDAVILDLSLGDGDGPALLRSWHHPIHGATAVVVEARSLAGSAYGELAATAVGRLSHEFSATLTRAR